MTFFDPFVKIFDPVSKIIGSQFSVLFKITQLVPQTILRLLGGVGQTAELLPILIIGGLGIAAVFLVKDLFK